MFVCCEPLQTHRSMILLHAFRAFGGRRAFAACNLKKSRAQAVDLGAASCGRAPKPPSPNSTERVITLSVPLCIPDADPDAYPNAVIMFM